MIVAFTNRVYHLKMIAKVQIWLTKCQICALFIYFGGELMLINGSQMLPSVKSESEAGGGRKSCN